MKISINLLKDQRGMTGLETAIILIAFVTVAAVFSYAVLSAGLFSAERGKETVYAGLQEARSNLEICGSVMATSTDSTNVAKVIFTLKNAIAGTPIDMTACNGTGNAANKCVISLTTSSDYLNNVKWTRTPVGTSDGDNLLEPGEMFEISVNMSDLGDNMTLSENLTANEIFSLQVKPALGSTITVQRTLPAAIGAVMDLDLGTSFGGGGSSGGSTDGSLPLYNIECVGASYFTTNSGYIDSLYINIQNNGASSIYLDLPDFTITSDGGTHQPTTWELGYDATTINPGYSSTMGFDLSSGRLTYAALDLNPGETFTIRTLDTLDTIKTLPDPLVLGSAESLP